MNSYCSYICVCVRVYSVAALAVQADHEQDKIPLVSFQLHSNFLNILYLLVCTSMCL